MSRRYHYRKKSGVSKFIIPLILVFVIACLAIGFIIIRQKKDSASDSSGNVEAPDYDSADKWSEGTISYGNKKYRYNNSIRTYLFLGIDSDEPVHKASDGISGGQSDAIFLLVENKSEKKMSLISIHRNTMTTVKMYNASGEYTGDATLQICLQHGYGDGERISCQRTSECVSNLFYGIPIHGYLSLNMGGIGLLNDAVGGVEVTVLETLDNDAKNVHLVEGQTKVLSGDEAYVYVRSRDINEFDSATARLERQEQYLNSLIPKLLKKMQHASSAASVYGKAEDYLYSNIDYSRLADELTDLTYDSEEDMYSIPGEVIKGDKFEEYHADEDGLYKLILNVFYNEVDE